ncbi:unnamed protein product [Staurois parvus]|uniref:Uncharacterized protein n=1 Tax=Staurois parvus TaxID=386267 RepID=A0ABN9HQD2_9NEOB|nr:unnamed protein product [Staurois parvus]
MEASGGIGRKGWRTLTGGQWRDWQRGVEDTEWRPVEGLAERDGRYGMIERLVRGSCSSQGGR